MTVSTTSSKVSYSGDGSTTVFAYTFKILENSDLVVLIRTNSTGVEVTQAITTNYTVSGAGDASGGNVTMVTAPASGETLVIKRVMPLTQATDYTPNDPFPAASHEDALDKLTLISQQHQETFDRAIVLPATDTASTSIPNSVDRANKYLAFDANGNVLTTTGTADVTPISVPMQPVVNATSLTLARNELFSDSGVSFDNSGIVSLDVLKLDDDDASQSIKIQSPSTLTTTTTFTLPDGDGYSGSALITDGSGTLSWAAPYTNRNLLINGDMRISQRGTSESSVTTSGYKKAPDRWRININGAGTHTVSQVSGGSPTGFYNHYRIACSLASTLSLSGAFLKLTQTIEGNNLTRLKKGTSDAESVTISFWVKSDVTGTYICEIEDDDNTRAISQSYTISAANTWEFKSLTFPGDTSGVLNTDANKSMEVHWWLAAGSVYQSGTLQTSWGSDTDANRAVGQVNLASSNTNDWQITGVQMEIGTTHTPFEYLTIEEQLTRCKRYYQQFDAGSGNRILGNGYFHAAAEFEALVPLIPEMRAAPVATVSNVTDFLIRRPGLTEANGTGTWTMVSSNVSPNHIHVPCDTDASSTIGFGGFLVAAGNAILHADAELS